MLDYTGSSVSRVVPVSIALSSTQKVFLYLNNSSRNSSNSDRSRRGCCIYLRTNCVYREQLSSKLHTIDDHESCYVQLDNQLFGGLFNQAVKQWSMLVMYKFISVWSHDLVKAGFLCVRFWQRTQSASFGVNTVSSHIQLDKVLVQLHFCAVDSLTN